MCKLLGDSMLLAKKYWKTIKELKIVLSQFKKVIVLYSGGKDSTLTAHLVIEAMKNEDINTKVIIAMSDTRVEMPWLWRRSNHFLAKIEQWSEEYGYNIETKIVRPPDDKTFWVTLIGKGYPMPHFRFRWCVRLLKILPMREYIKENMPALILMGTRWDESSERNRNMKKRNITGKWTRYMGIKDAMVYLPIVDWTTNDVMNALKSLTTPWGTSYSDLFGLYLMADTCHVLEDGTFKCNGSRFGCWTCSVVRKDKTLCSLAENGCKLAKSMLDFKRYLIKTTRNERNRIKKSNNRYGVVKKNVRKRIFEKLLSFCSDVEKFMFDSYKIISDDEIEIIQEMLY